MSYDPMYTVYASPSVATVRLFVLETTSPGQPAQFLMWAKKPHTQPALNQPVSNTLETEKIFLRRLGFSLTEGGVEKHPVSGKRCAQFNPNGGHMG